MPRRSWRTRRRPSHLSREEGARTLPYSLAPPFIVMTPGLRTRNWALQRETCSYVTKGVHSALAMGTAKLTSALIAAMEATFISPDGTPYFPKEHETIDLPFVANLEISTDATQVTCVQSIVAEATAGNVGKKL